MKNSFKERKILTWEERKKERKRQERKIYKMKGGRRMEKETGWREGRKE